MKNLETNKIAAAILVAGLIALTTGKIANSLYHTGHHHGEVEKRGFEVAVVDNAEASEEGNDGKEEVVDVAALMASANAEEGSKIFKKCVACHSTDDGVNKVGPSLHGVVDRKQASYAGYSYSDALFADKSWNYEELFHFLKKPKKYAPGTKMGFQGIKNPTEIANLIAYLETVK